MLSTSDRGFVKTVAEWGRNRSAVFAFQFSNPGEQNRGRGNQQLLVFRRGFGEGSYSLEKSSWSFCESWTLPALNFYLCTTVQLFQTWNWNIQTFIGLGRPAVICHVRQRWVERIFSPTVSYLLICFLQYSRDSLQTSHSSAPSLPWKTLSIVLCCHWDIFISCSASTSLTHMQSQGKSACLCGQGLASTACILTPQEKSMWLWWLNALGLLRKCELGRVSIHFNCPF